MSEEAKKPDWQGTIKGAVYIVKEIPEKDTFVVSPLNEPETGLTVKAKNFNPLTPVCGIEIGKKKIEAGSYVCFYTEQNLPELCVHIATPLDIVRYRRGEDTEPKLWRVYTFTRFAWSGSNDKNLVRFYDKRTGLGGQAEVRINKEVVGVFEQGDLIVFDKLPVELSEEFKKNFGIDVEESLGEDMIARRPTPLETLFYRKQIGEEPIASN